MKLDAVIQTSLSLTLSAILPSACSFSLAVIKSDDGGDVAYWYNMNHGAAEQAELQSRNAIPTAEWPAIDQNQVEIGMGPIALEVAWVSRQPSTQQQQPPDRMCNGCTYLWALQRLTIGA